MTGHQWWWEARYPKSGVVVANEIHIPVGKPLSVRLESTDVLHEFWVPELARKITAVPGHPNHIWLQADTAGDLSRHLLGILRNAACLDAFSRSWPSRRSNFAAWEKAQLGCRRNPGERRRGTRVSRFSKQMSCVSCHAINGTAAAARVGPDLTHFASRRNSGAGIADNTPENLRRWLADPQQVKPGVKMPTSSSPTQQVTQLRRLFRDVEMNEITTVLDRAGS